MVVCHRQHDSLWAPPAQTTAGLASPTDDSISISHCCRPLLLLPLPLPLSLLLSTTTLLLLLLRNLPASRHMPSRVVSLSRSSLSKISKAPRERRPRLQTRAPTVEASPQVAIKWFPSPLLPLLGWSGLDSPTSVVGRNLFEMMMIMMTISSCSKGLIMLPGSWNCAACLAWCAGAAFMQSCRARAIQNGNAEADWKSSHARNWTGE